MILSVDGLLDQIVVNGARCADDKIPVTAGLEVAELISADNYVCDICVVYLGSHAVIGRGVAHIGVASGSQSALTVGTVHLKILMNEH